MWSQLHACPGGVICGASPPQAALYSYKTNFDRQREKNPDWGFEWCRNYTFLNFPWSVCREELEVPTAVVLVGAAGVMARAWVAVPFLSQRTDMHLNLLCCGSVAQRVKADAVVARKDLTGTGRRLAYTSVSLRF